MAVIPDVSHRELGAIKVNKDHVDNAHLDLNDFRTGKEGLATKKKKRSALKKLIVAEREVRMQEADFAHPVPISNESRPAVEADASLAAFSLDAPEFVPTGWAPMMPAATSLEKHGLETEGASESAEPAAADRGSGSQPASSRKVEEQAKRRAPGSAAMKAPEFVPSWCHPPDASDDRAAPELNDFGLASLFDDDEQLAVSKAIERMSAQKKEEQSKSIQAKTAKKPPKTSNLEVRHYVRQVLSDELDEKVKAMLADLARFQERTKERDPQKFAKLKRFCVGTSEATRTVKRGKAKCLVMAPNLDRSEADGGLDDTMEDLMDLCFEHEVPVVFALSRNRMGKALGKNMRMSIVCVLSAEGVHQEFKQIIKMAEDLRRQWVMRRMALGVQEVMAEDEACQESGDVVEKETMNARVLRHLEEQRQIEARRHAEAKAVRDAEKAVDKERKKAERAAKLEERRAAQKAENDAEAKKLEEEEKILEEAEAEKRRLAAIKEAQRQELIEKEKERRAEKERLAEEERRRVAEQDAAAAAVAGSDDSDSDDDDLPAGFNADFF